MRDLRQEIGRWIYSVRKMLNVTQEKFGAMIGVEGNTVSTYETGDSYPSVAVLVNIIDIANAAGPDKWALIAKDLSDASLERILSADELQAVKLYKELRAEDRETILQLMEALGKKGGGK